MKERPYITSALQMHKYTPTLTSTHTTYTKCNTHIQNKIKRKKVQNKPRQNGSD